MASDCNYTFEGWMAHDENSIGNLKFESFEPKPWEEDDVDIKISHTGICASDLHTLRSGWVCHFSYRFPDATLMRNARDQRYIHV
jgi:D-arabinose 1-dehydrogenase-like Zn-dependent alcohol dehydrogenase